MFKKTNTIAAFIANYARHDRARAIAAWLTVAKSADDDMRHDYNLSRCVATSIQAAKQQLARQA